MMRWKVGREGRCGVTRGEWRHKVMGCVGWREGLSCVCVCVYVCVCVCGGGGEGATILPAQYSHQSSSPLRYQEGFSLRCFLSTHVT